MRPIQFAVEARRDAPRAFASPLLIIYAFVGLVGIGTVLLSLPFTHQGQGVTPFSDALFTSTSAVTVTGLVVNDTSTYWTPWGKAILTGLIFVGGLGFMTLATFALVLIGQRITLSQRLIIRESMGTSQLGGLVRLILGVVVLALAMQLIGTVILSIRLWASYPPLEAIGTAIFHSVSAFNNAGFTIFAEDGGLAAYRFDGVIIGTTAVLVVLGGLGFAVITDVARSRRFSLFSLNTKLVLVMTAALILVGTAVFIVFEYKNPDTLGPLSVVHKLSLAVFESISTRTAGFSTIDYSKTEQQTDFFVPALMFIGGASVSVAGGIKVNTVAIILVAVLSAMRGKRYNSVFGRVIPDDQVNRALSIGVIAAGIVFLSVISLSVTEHSMRFLDLFFESVSAFGTVGLSTGITGDLSTWGRFILIFTMFIGRIGPFTVAIALAQGNDADLYGYPVEPVTLG